MALPIIPKVEFNFEVLLYVTILVYLSPGSFSRSAIRWYQNSISKHTYRSSCYSRLLKQGKILHQKDLRGLCAAKYSILRALTHWFVLFLSILSPKEVISPFWMRTRPSCKIWPTIQCAVITSVFLVLWSAGHLGCVWGGKSINNGVITGKCFWSRTSRAHSCIALAPLIRLFCRLQSCERQPCHNLWLKLTLKEIVSNGSLEMPRCSLKRSREAK